MSSDTLSRSTKKKRTGPCDHCGEKESTQWRVGPPTCPTLCNACGVHWGRKKKLPVGRGSQAKKRPANRLEVPSNSESEDDSEAAVVLLTLANGADKIVEEVQPQVVADGGENAQPEAKKARMNRLESIESSAEVLRKQSPTSSFEGGRASSGSNESVGTACVWPTPSTDHIMHMDPHSTPAGHETARGSERLASGSEEEPCCPNGNTETDGRRSNNPVEERQHSAALASPQWPQGSGSQFALHGLRRLPSISGGMGAYNSLNPSASQSSAPATMAAQAAAAAAWAVNFLTPSMPFNLFYIDWQQKNPQGSWAEAQSTWDKLPTAGENSKANWQQLASTALANFSSSAPVLAASMFGDLGAKESESEVQLQSPGAQPTSQAEVTSPNAKKLALGSLHQNTVIPLGAKAA